MALHTIGPCVCQVSRINTHKSLLDLHTNLLEVKLSLALCWSRSTEGRDDQQMSPTLFNTITFSMKSTQCISWKHHKKLSSTLCAYMRFVAASVVTEVWNNCCNCRGMYWGLIMYICTPVVKYSKQSMQTFSVCRLLEYSCNILRFCYSGNCLPVA